MGLVVQRIGLACVLLVALLGHAAHAQKDAPEPEPAPLLSPRDQPEPEPAPLEPPEPEPAPLVSVAPKPPSIDGRLRLVKGLRGVAWTGVALTLSLFTTGTVTGLLAQQRSDDLSSATAVSGGSPAPMYDAGQRANYLGLQSDGQLFNTTTIACFAAGSALAIVSGVLFWRATRLDPRDKLRAALVPTVTSTGGMVGLVGRF